MYSEKVIKLFHKPKFHKKPKKFNGEGKVGNPVCGDVMRIFINVKNNVIKDIGVETFGCVAAIASSDILCSLAKGRTLKNALKISKKEVINELGGLPPQKIHCSLLAVDALKKAVEDYKNG